MTTRLGEEVLQGDMDVGANLLVAVSKKMGIERIGKVAAAFVACKRDLFEDLFDGRGATGLSLEQLAIAEGVGSLPPCSGYCTEKRCGDVHTAVRWYLEWVRLDPVAMDS